MQADTPMRADIMSGTVYSNLKVLQDPARLAVMRAGGIPTPIHVRIKPTNVCNHACSFCAYRAGNLALGAGMNARDRLPLGKMMEIIGDLIDMGVQAVTFSGGGEPLIYPHIAEAVRRLAEGGIRVGALTNGSRLLGKVADAFAEHATWIRVSIDGWDAESYARSREVRHDAFGKLLVNLRAFAQRGSPCALGASLIVDRANGRHIAELARALKDCGVQHVKVSPCIVANTGGENNAYHAPLLPIVREQLGEAVALEDETFHVIDHYHALEEKFERPYRTCGMARLLTVIGADARVYTCQDKAYTEGGLLGSIEERSFKDFWFSEENRRALEAIDPQRDCPHHCVADTKNRLLSEALATAPDHAAFV